MTLVLLDENILAADIGWRVCCFGIGAVLGLGILLVRRHVPESPRWLFIHGHDREADRLVEDIERTIAEETGRELPPPEGEPIEIRQRTSTSFVEIARTMVRCYPRRSVLGLGLFIGQAFLYNAVFFTQALVLSTFFGVASGSIGWYIIPLALGNFAGPMLLGHLFDTVGRRVMISISYVGSGLLLAGTAALLSAGVFGAWTLTLAWCLIFFLASAGASAAYLTVSEIFPMETRAMAIALFYSVGTGLGGIIGPHLFAKLVETGELSRVAFGYYLGAAVMILGDLTEVFLGVNAEQKSLEDVAEPLSAQSVGSTRQT
jgi:MFS family permease